MKKNLPFHVLHNFVFSFSIAQQVAFALSSDISEVYWQNQPQEVLYKKGVLTNSSKFTGKHLCQSVFFKRLYCRFFPVNFPKFVRPLFFTKYLGATASVFRTMSNMYDRTFLWKYRSSRPEVFFKNVFLEISQNSLENTCARVRASFLRIPFLKEHR